MDASTLIEKQLALSVADDAPIRTPVEIRKFTARAPAPARLFEKLETRSASIPLQASLIRCAPDRDNRRFATISIV